MADSVRNQPFYKDPRFAIPLCLLGLMLLSLGDMLVDSSGSLVLGTKNTDVGTEFVYWREFGFDQLRHGHLAFWDPHVFSGVPFFGGWQAALLYPPNWIYLVLPHARAINFEIAISVFLTGWFTALWARRNGFSAISCVLAGAMVMLGGPYFFHIYAGHLCTLDAMAWMPLILLAVDEMCDSPGLRPALIGSGAMAMQILAGHPQTVFITGITAILYGAFRVLQSSSRVKAAAGCIGFVALGVGIAAIQMLSGLGTAKEGVRQAGVSYAFSSSLSFPPENLLTFVVPKIFGDWVHFPYWGRWYPWEMCAFVGICGLSLALTGIAAGWKRSGERTWAILAGVLILICLGGYTPLFHVLYNFVPGFNKLRSHSKFIYPAILFVALLAASGLDSLLREDSQRWLRGLFVGLGVASAALFVAAGAIARPSIGPRFVYGLFEWFKSHSDQGFAGEAVYSADNIAHVIAYGAPQIAIAATTCLLLAAVIWSAIEKRRSVYIFAAIGMIELVVFARSTVASFDINSTVTPQFQQFLASDPGDYRIMQGVAPANSAIPMGASDVWGYDPTVLKRYAEFMNVTQGLSPDTAGEYLKESQVVPLLRLLRLKYVIVPRPNGAAILRAHDYLPHALLIDQVLITPNRDADFAVMTPPSFDPFHQITLEKQPVPAPIPSGSPIGTVQVTSPNPDSLTIDATASRPAILLITDTYSKGWTATALPGSAQQNYQVVPADYTLRGIPLQAGHHRILMQYTPPGFYAGRAITIVSLVVYLMLCGFYWRKRGESNDQATHSHVQQSADQVQSDELA